MKKLLFIGLIASLLHADITHVSIWEKSLEDGQKQKLVMCGDYHEIQNVGHQQAEIIAEIAARSKNNHIIVEDINDLNDLKQHLHDFLAAKNLVAPDAVSTIEKLYQEYEDERMYQAQHKIPSALFLLTHFAKAKDVSCINIDFRQLLTTDAPHIKIGKEDVAFIKWIMERVIGSLSAYDDGDQLQSFNKQKINQFKPFMDYMCSVMEKEQLVYQQLSSYFCEYFFKNPELYDADYFMPAKTEDLLLVKSNLDDIINRIKNGDSSARIKQALSTMLDFIFELSMIELVDAMILHEIAEKQTHTDEANTLFVCVGQAHMEQVETMLPALGYASLDALSDEKAVDIEDICQKHLTQEVQYNWFKNITSILASIMAWFGLQQ